jgi:hypothetical protein
MAQLLGLLVIVFILFLVFALCQSKCSPPQHEGYPQEDGFPQRENYANQVVHASVGGIAGPVGRSRHRRHWSDEYDYLQDLGYGSI